MRDTTRNVSGSSPLARGLRDVEFGRAVDRGIIPARAGFTVAVVDVGGPPGDHPRSRRVYLEHAGLPAVTAGSSPLARGLLDDTGGSTVAGGIIPARAGFTTAMSAGRVVPRDHPRSRGVYRRDGDDVTVTAGSSPLARGLPIHMACESAAQGIIPARAGFTMRPLFFDRGMRDHPRSRGVYSRPTPRVG